MHSFEHLRVTETAKRTDRRAAANTGVSKRTRVSLTGDYSYSWHELHFRVSCLINHNKAIKIMSRYLPILRLCYSDRWCNTNIELLYMTSILPF